MDVRCPQCQTLYELDERQLAKGAVTLKCSRCQHVFRFESGSSSIQENQRRWMINSSRDGAVLYLNDFTDLHRWIMEKKVRPRDTISRTGKSWVELSSIPEFAPIFIVVESISDLTGSPEDSHIATRVREASAGNATASAPANERANHQTEQNSNDDPTSGSPAGQSSAPQRPRVQTELQYPDASGSMPVASNSSAPPSQPQSQPRTESPTRRSRPPRPTPGDLPPRPGVQNRVDTGEHATPASAKPSSDDTLEDAWSIGSDHESRREEMVSANFSTIESPSRAPIVVALIIFLLGGGAAALYVTQPELVARYIAPLKGDGAVVALGDTTADASDDTDAALAVAEETADPRSVVSSAYASAFQARDRRHAEIFDGVLFSTRQPIDEALSVAQVTAEKAAEGGLTDDRLAEARRALERGSLRKAEGLFQDVLEFEPRNADAVAGLGFIYLEQSNASRAASQFRKSIDLGAGDGSAYIGLGTAERQLDNPEGAFKAYDLYLGRYPRGEKASIARYQLEQLRKQLGM